MSDKSFEQLLRFFKVLGNESRLKLLGLLAGGERSVGELAEMLDVKEPTVSHHLAMMKDLGLVSVRADGNARLYQLDTRVLEQMSRDIFSQGNLAQLVDDTGVDAQEQKVLRAFLDGEQIKAIPAQHKKQRVLLNWLADKFEPDRRYTEAEVNDVIKRHHGDYAWFRRALIDQQYMARDKGIYWRL
ncbi:MAG: metalloregulator ArsR/SmtB family transcription factor [Anaerolineales bacterium]|nr:metalloregulator ArsR/SmtB family transcription factor [Anaerolineales bacterium]